MSELDWFVTRSSLPDVFKEVLYDLVNSIDTAIEGELDEVSGGFKDRIDAIETSLDDGSGGDSLIDVCSLSNEVDDLIKRVLELEEPEDPEEEAMEEEAKEDMGEIEVELKEMEPQESDWKDHGKVKVRDGQVLKEIACPYCGGKIEIT